MHVDGTQLLIWEPSIYRAELSCKGCSNNIAPKSVFFVHSNDVRYLIPNSGNDAYSVRCASCGLTEFMQSEFGSMFRDSIRSYKPSEDYGSEMPLVSFIKQLVRDELKQILKHEAFDPNGPFSPAE